jgi:hypothetical protein
VDPELNIEITDASIVPQISETFDEGRRGVPSADFAATADAGHGEVAIEGFVYPTSIGHLLMAMFGADAKTGASDPWTHTFDVQEDVPSYTIEERLLGTGSNDGLRSVGSVLSALNFTFERATGVLRYTSQWLGNIPEIVTVIDPSPNFEEGIQGWKAAVTSTNLTNRVLAGEINFSRESQVIHATNNSQQPKCVEVGPVRIEGQLTLLTDTLVDFTSFITDVKQQLAISFAKGVTPARTLNFNIQNAALAASPIDWDMGGVALLNRLSFRAIHNSTDDGPGVAVLINGQTDAY